MNWKRLGDSATTTVPAAGPPPSSPAPREPTAVGRGRTVVLVATFLVLVVGIVAMLVSRGGDDRVASVPPTAVTTPTTVAPPELLNMGEDFDAVYRSIAGFQAWAYMNPDSRLARVVADERCACFPVIEQGLAALKADGEHHNGPQVRVVSVEAQERTFPNQQTLYVVIDGVGGQIVNDAGVVIQDVPNPGSLGFFVELIRGSDDRWRILQSDCLGRPGIGRNEGCP